MEMDIDSNRDVKGVRNEKEFESELAAIRDKQTYRQPLQVNPLGPGSGSRSWPHNYGSTSPDRSTGAEVEVTAELPADRVGQVDIFGSELPSDEEITTPAHQEHDSSLQHQYNGINGDASGSGYAIFSGNNTARGHHNGGIVDEDEEQVPRSRGLSIVDLITGPPLRPTHSHSFSNTSTPTSISPATPEDHPSSPYRYRLGPISGPGSIHSPVPIRSRPSFVGSRPGSALGSPSTHSTARPIHYSYNRRPGPVHASSSHTSRQRASPYPPTSAARYEGVGLGINMINTPSTPSNSGSSLGHDADQGQPGPGNISPSLQSPGSMARRRKAPEWPEAKTSRSHSFNSASTPRDMYQTLKTPAALRVPSTAQLLSPAYRPGMESPMVIPGSAGPGPIRRGIPPSSAPPLSAARIDSAIPPTPRRVHLLDVPRAKVISTLNERAGRYWFDPSTSDCRICKSLYLPSISLT